VQKVGEISNPTGRGNGVGRGTDPHITGGIEGTTIGLHGKGPPLVSENRLGVGKQRGKRGEKGGQRKGKKRNEASGEGEQLKKKSYLYA